MTVVIPMQAVTVATEYDVVLLRQQVRQIARDLGLSLIQQAKVATAVTTIARGFLALQHGTTFVMRTSAVQPRASFEIGGDTLVDGLPDDLVRLDDLLRLKEARLLVDELDLAFEHGFVQVTLRVWLSTSLH